VRVTFDLPEDVLRRLKKLCRAERRSSEDMIAHTIMTWSSERQAFNPIKSDGPVKRKYKLIPDGHPTRVVMNRVVVSDVATKQPLSLDRVAVSFSERRVDGAVSIVPSVESGFIDYHTGEPVSHISINTPDGPQRITRMALKVINAGDLVSRWLAGSYDSVDDWEQYVLKIVRVKDGRAYVEMAPVVAGRFVPSEEQYEEYREGRGWTEEQIEKFIELRSRLVPGGPDWLGTLNGLYTQVDRMEVQ